MKKRNQNKKIKKTARENFLNLSAFPKHFFFSFFPSTKTDKTLGIGVKTILLQFVHKIVNKKKTGKMSWAKYILIFILHNIILCVFRSNLSTNKKSFQKTGLVLLIPSQLSVLRHIWVTVFRKKAEISIWNIFVLLVTYKTTSLSTL